MIQLQTLMVIIMLAFSVFTSETQSNESTFISEGNSMAPFLQNEEKLIVDKDYYKSHPVAHGDVIVFKDDKNKTHVKRVISISGDIMEYKEDTLYINNKPVDEPYLTEYKLEAKQDETLRVTEDYGPYTIPQGTVFVLGDNRWNSYDSRVFGPIKVGQIIGKVVK